jgi:proteic killer suppression protein
MHIESLRHKGLRQLYLDDITKGVPANLVDKLRKQLFAMETAENLDALTCFPGWRLHRLKGDLAQCWSLTVTGNWRLIFQYDAASNTASLVDLLDYH